MARALTKLRPSATTVASMRGEVAIPFETQDTICVSVPESITMEWAVSVLNQMFSLRPFQRVDLVVSSFGGDVIATSYLIRRLLEIENPIRVEFVGLVCSAAVLFAALPKMRANAILTTKNCQAIMIHAISWVSFGDAITLKAGSEILARTYDATRDIEIAAYEMLGIDESMRLRALREEIWIGMGEHDGSLYEADIVKLKKLRS